MRPFEITVREGKVILLALFVLLSVKCVSAQTIIPTTSITLDGNPADWSSIDTVCTDAQGDDNTGYTGADIKSFKFAQDSNYVYVMADFYDGAPNEALGQKEDFAYQFHFADVGTSGGPLSSYIDSLGVFHDGSKWDINYLSLMNGVSGSLTGSSVAVDSVIELKIPKDKLPDSFDFCLQIGTSLGIDGVLGDVTEWKTLYCVAPPLIEKQVKTSMAGMTVSYNWVHETNGEDIYHVSKIHAWTFAVGTGVADFSITRGDVTIWRDVWIISGVKAHTYVSPFTPTNRWWELELGSQFGVAPKITNEGIEVRASDKMNVRTRGLQYGPPGPGAGPWIPSPNVDTASTTFHPDAPVELTTLFTPLENVWNWIAGKLFSPSEIRVYDTQGRTTGLVNGEVREEIPYSAYNDNMFIILLPSDLFTYEVAGTDEGSYGLGITSPEEEEVTHFIAHDIPISTGAIHHYTIDWDVLSRGEEGVTIQIDSDGDGEFEWTGTSDSEFTSDDITLPTGSILINNDAAYTNSRNATLTLEATNTSYMCFSNDNSSWSDWEDYATEKSWTLTSGDGTKTVYVKFKDDAGNVSEIYSDTIILDTTPPPAPTISSSTHPDESKWYNNNDPAVSWTEPDDLSGISGYSHVMDRSSTTTPDETSEGESTSKGYRNVAEGTWYFHVRAVDGVGHWGETDHYRIKVDTTPPEATLIDYPTEIVTGNTPKVAVIFTWTGSDPNGFTPVEKLVYQYKLEGHPDYQDWSGWTLDTTEICTLPSGNYTFKVRAKDEAGNYPDEDDPATAKSSFTVSLPIIIYPNPCYPNQGQTITIANLPLTSEVRICIYDLAGNLIRTLGESEVNIEGGSKTATWDLRNDNGELVTTDIYIYLILSATEKKTGKVAIIKKRV